MVRVVCISDTHCRLRNVKVPDGDILVHAGDLTFQGNVAEISQELRELGRIAKRFKKTYLVAGNHDWLPFHHRLLMEEMCKNEGVTYLQDSWDIYEGLVIFGSPWQPEFCSWAFNLPRGEKLKTIWDNIPDKVDILVTHSPPANILDSVPHGIEHVGCVDLFNRVMKVKPQLHVFGHIHFSYGMKQFDGITFVNASICDEQYKPINAPIVIDLD